MPSPYPLRAAFAACAIVLLAGPALAAAAALKLPPETAKLRPSTLAGYVVATQKCAACHSADYVNYQPPGMSQAQWTAEVAKMQHAYGAPISDDDVKQIGAYLAVAYGSAKASDVSVIAASPAPQAVAAAPPGAAPAAVIDVQALLNGNGCMACHAVDKKIVGPAFHDVAAKYKGDAHALAKVQTSIQQGGVSKWGDTRMPPMAGLSPAQLKALAEYVLKR